MKKYAFVQVYCLDQLVSNRFCVTKLEDHASHKLSFISYLALTILVWTSWSDWTGCSATCNGGSRSRDRVCTHLIPNVIQCSGHSTEVEVCGNTICPASECYLFFIPFESRIALFEVLLIVILQI